MAENKTGFINIKFVILLLVAATITFGILYSAYIFDNKYTKQTPKSEMGFTWIDQKAYQDDPIFFLTGQWEFFDGKLMSPNELEDSEAIPDAYVYPGEHGGFDLGDPQKKRHGSGTYRMTVMTGKDSIDTYSLELTKHYSNWSLWIEGVLWQSKGTSEPEISKAVPAVTFQAKDSIEIVVAVEDSNGIYSGMVYPPAFGNPDSVSRAIIMKLIFHSLQLALGLFVGLFFLLAGIRLRFSRPYVELALLCLCFSIITSYPLFSVMDLAVDPGLILRFSYYAMFGIMVFMQGRLLGVEKKFFYTVTAVCVLVCASVLVQPLLGMSSGGEYHFYGQMLTWFKWLICVYLLVVSFWGVVKGKDKSRALLVGFVVFAIALAFDRVFPDYEPIVTGWPLEFAGLVIMLIVSGILWTETIEIFKSNIELRQQKLLDQAQIEAQREFSIMQKNYVTLSEKTLHEYRNNIIVMKKYTDERDMTKLENFIDELLKDSYSERISYTGNSLIDSILSIQLKAIEQNNIYVEHEFGNIDEHIAVADSDVSSVIMNILDNAIEANSHIPNADNRWIHILIENQDGRLVIESLNASAGTSSKGRGHGHGLKIIQDIVEKNGGTLEINRADDHFGISVRL